MGTFYPLSPRLENAAHNYDNVTFYCLALSQFKMMSLVNMRVTVALAVLILAPWIG
jgi:hypothetical protein